MAEKEEVQKHKGHHGPHSGRKLEKKKTKTAHVQEMTAKQKNPKAFAFHSAVKAERKFRRTMDIKAKRQHVPLVDRTPLQPPPFIVAIVGPPKVGKTTLMQCLIKNFTRQNMSTVRGPVTVVSGKKRRLTLIECNNDINNMIDIAKVADLVLLLVDASFGFEMETFEFLNICQVNGFPRIMGVLTHLDLFKNNKTLRRTKKQMKHRFWTEIYQGAKLFYLSGMIRNEYLKNEIHNLGRFISVMKFRPLKWRTTHPYVLADRMEDLTNPENVRQDPACNRIISLYGYTRGAPLKNNSFIHIAGCGDYFVNDVSFLPDPCPLPEKEKRRSLNQKERLIYAPLSGVGGIVYDKDAVYIELQGSHSHAQQTQEECKEPNREMINSLISTQQTIDAKMAASQFTLFSGATPLSEAEINRIHQVQFQVVQDQDTVRRKVVFNDENENKIMDIDNNEEEDDNASDEIKKKSVNCDEMSTDDEESDEEADSEDEESTEDDEEEDKESSGNDESEEFNDGCEDDKKLITKSEEESTCTNSPKKQKIEVACSSSEDESEHNKNRSLKKEFRRGKLSGCDKMVVDNVRLSSEKVLNEAENEEVSFENYNADMHSESFVCNKSVKKTVKFGDTKENDTSDNLLSSSKLSELKYSSDDANNDGDDIDGNIRWKDNLAQKAADAFYKRQTDSVNLQKLVYGDVESNQDDSEEESDKELGGIFRLVKKKCQKRQSLFYKSLDDIDCSKFVNENRRDWSLSENLKSIQDCFVTGKWDESEDAETVLKKDDALYGDFEDLETGHVEKQNTSTEEEDDDDQADDTASVDNNNVEARKMNTQKTLQEKRLEKKRKLKEMFDVEYDDNDKSYYDDLKNELDQQAQLNKSEFENMDDELRVQYEGFRPGMYVRIEVENVPCEFVTNFDPTYPIIVGGLLKGEDNVGYVQIRLKKHRWYPKILKNRDPLIISLGWRRFQTLPVYSIQDHNGRNRLLKYTPQHLHCHATFWGPITPQGTGLIALQTVSEVMSNFRVAATGVVLDLDHSTQIVKKLKLTGVPFKIYKKTAFIKSMFHSILEVTKFEGASLRTVSGIRGQIKKAIRAPEGAFRATFEDKILLSDIVFLRAWSAIQVPKFCVPLATLLLPPDQKAKWQGMKTVGRLRHEMGIHAPVNQDSFYTPIERKPRVFAPLVIPKDLQKSLPYRDKPKSKVSKTSRIENERVAVIREPHEREVAHVMKMLKTVYGEKQRKEHRAMWERAKAHKKQKQLEEAKKNERQRDLKKRIFRVLKKMDNKKKSH